MSTYFIGDLHFGHANIHKFRLQFSDEISHRGHLIACWNNTITKRDLVYVMGDAAFTEDGLASIGSLSGRKILIRGNHDLLPTESYLEYFEEVHGIIKYKEFWLSHVPIHPQELWGRTNIHGHCHFGGPLTPSSVPSETNLRDKGRKKCDTKATYYNTCAEHLPTPYHPIELEHLRKLVAERLREG